MKRIIYRTLGPLLLMTLCPFLAILMWYINVSCQGLFSLFEFKAFMKVWRSIFFGSQTAWMMLFVFAAVQLMFMKWLPGKPFQGPVSPTGHVPTYKANGVLAFFCTLTLYFLGAFPLHLFSPAIIYDHFGPLLAALNLFSFIFCAFLYVKGRFFPSSTDHGTSGHIIFDYYWGTELYPRVFGFDVKQFTNCRFGMMSWCLILISFAAKQHELYGLSNAMIVSLLLQFIYVAKFFFWETGYLRSLDIMHDRAGFYICWGCLVWVPAIYTSPALYLVNRSPVLSLGASILLFTLGSLCILLNYLADRERQGFRKAGGECLVWGKKPKVTLARYKTSEGVLHTNVLLASGFWGITRHFHYILEILGAFFWSVVALFASPLPYFYVVFLTCILIERSVRDDRRCLLKYGEDWKAHCDKVPYRLIPFIF